MSNVSTPSNRMKENIKSRWLAEDFPGGPKHFQVQLFAKDIFVYLGIPIIAVILFKGCEMSLNGTAQVKTSSGNRLFRSDGSQPKSQIIDFHESPNSLHYVENIPRRAPGTLVKVRLMNIVETASITPVHAQIIDDGLGKQFRGSTLIGEANPDGALGRIRIDFKYLRLTNRLDIAVPLTGRALSLDGTFGLIAEKKEGFFARAAIRSAQNGNTVDTSPQDFKSVIARALAAGLVQEFQGEAAQANQQAQVLTLQPSTEFFVELSDYFPGTSK
jgi:hypothetical protein